MDQYCKEAVVKGMKSNGVTAWFDEDHWVVRLKRESGTFLFSFPTYIELSILNSINRLTNYSCCACGNGLYSGIDGASQELPWLKEDQPPIPIFLKEGRFLLLFSPSHLVLFKRS